jgi:hypothetical protein
MKNKLFIALSLSIGFIACGKKQINDDLVSIKHTKSVEILSEAEITAKNIAFITSTIEAHDLMLQSNSNLAVTYSRGVDGKVSATFDSNGQASIDGNADAEGREILCKGATVLDIAKCMDEHMKEFGICLVTYQCAICASEGPCPGENPNP